MIYVVPIAHIVAKIISMSPILTILREKKKMSKIHVACRQFGTKAYIYTSEFICLITNQATDAIKTIVNTVKMKLRKLRRRMSEILTKLDNLSKTEQVLEMFPVGFHADAHGALGSQKSFM